MRPRTQIALSVAAAAALISTAIAAPVSHGGRKFTVSLTGTAEQVGGAAVGTFDADATGTATVYVNVGQRRVCWEFTDLMNLDAAVGETAVRFTGAHIHEAPVNASAGVVVGFFGSNNVDLEGCTASNLDRALLTDIIQNPQDYYVNLHTARYPAGAIRGQMSK